MCSFSTVGYTIIHINSVTGGTDGQLMGYKAIKLELLIRDYQPIHK
jgi:hypothetical protein